MYYGVVMHISHLKVGDVVRLIHGELRQREYVRAAIEYSLADGSKRVVEDTRGYLSPSVGGEGDFRRGYDTATVVEVTDDVTTLQRPHLHVYSDGIVQGVETIKVSRDHYGLWYELLS